MVYPNPTKGYDVNLKIYGTVAEITDYTIMDVMGRNISSGKVNDSTGIMNLKLPNNCVNGTYFIYLNDKSGKTIINEEFVVQH